MVFDEEWRALRDEAAGRVYEPVPDPVALTREAVRERLADFRGRLVLVPLDERGGLWTTRLGGLDWICAFSGEEALARFAEARGEAAREWEYRLVAGARLLDELVAGAGLPVRDRAGRGGAGGDRVSAVAGVRARWGGARR